MGPESAGLFYLQRRGVTFPPLPIGRSEERPSFDGLWSRVWVRALANPYPALQPGGRMSRSSIIIEESATMKSAPTGRLLRREMQARNLSANALALALRVNSGRITDILNGKRGVSPETADAPGSIFRQ